MKRISILAGVGLIVGLAFCLLAGSRLSQPVPQAMGAPPADIETESVEFPSESGSRIHGWLMPSGQRRGTILLLPGVRANRLSMLGRARVFHEAGYNALLVDLQATGESPGDAITFGWRERFDVTAAVEFLRNRYPDQPIGIVGTSLGGAATVLAAPGLDAQAVVLEAVYPSIDAAVKNRLRMRLGRLGGLLSPLLLVQLEPRLGVSVSELRPIERIPSLRCPVFVIGGTADRHTTAEDTQRLFDAAPEPKRLWLVANAGHVDFLAVARAEYVRRVVGFFDQYLA